MSALEILQTRPTHPQCGHGTFASGDGSPVGDFGQRGDHDARSRHLGAPAKIEVFAQGGDERIKATQRGEEVRAHQGDTARGHEDVSFEVLLAVIDFAQLHAFADHAESVAVLADVEQGHRVVVFDNLRGHHSGVGPVGRFDQTSHAVGLEADVVVAEQPKGRSVHHHGRLVTGGPESTVFL